MATLEKRKTWRPSDEAGVFHGGARGFHLPQVPGRKSYLNTPKRRSSSKQRQK